MQTAPQTFGLLPEFCRQNSSANQACLQTGTGWKHGEQTLPQGKSAACNYKKSSGSLSVKLLRPEITKAEWQDADGNSASKGLVGDTLKLHAETKDMAEGAGVRFCVYNSRTGEKVAEPAAKVDGSKADAEWTYHYDPSVTLKEKPKFYFTADAPRTKQKKSSDVEISGKINVQFVDKQDYAVNNIDYQLFKETDEADSGKLDKGCLKKEDLVPGCYQILFKHNTDNCTTKESVEKNETCREEVLLFEKLGIEKKTVQIEGVTRIVFINDSTEVSE